MRNYEWQTVATTPKHDVMQEVQMRLDIIIISTYQIAESWMRYLVSPIAS